MADPQLIQPDTLSAPHIVEYPYTRSVGPVIGSFLAALKDHRVEGVRATDGRVIVPPLEYDPLTGDPLDEFVAVGETGTVVTWAWVPEPRKNHPLERPFAWALVRLDGADTSLLHALDAGNESAVSSGMRVRIRWREETAGEIQDIACFEPAGEGSPQS